jgi:hypothetical protein
MVHKPYLYNRALSLRKEGHSYNYISKHLNIPKSTLSSWFSNKLWSRKIMTSLINKNKNYWNLSLKYARDVNTKRKEERYHKYINEAEELYQSLKKNPLFLIGLTAYWGEGKKSGGNVVSLSNTDPELIRLVEIFYIKCLKIHLKKLRVGLFLYKDIHEDRAKEFWSSILSIPKDQFIKTQFLKSRSVLTKRKSKYGICNLYFSSTEYSIKIQQWIKLLGLDYLRV